MNKISVEDIKSILDNLAENLVLNEAKFVRVIRGGKIQKKIKPRVGFKILRTGNKVKMKRVTVKEKRNRSLAIKKAWRKNHAGRVIKSKKKMIISLRKRKTIFGK